MARYEFGFEADPCPVDMPAFHINETPETYFMTSWTVIMYEPVKTVYLIY